ncbi:MAG: CIA30 family protein, partial [Planctomycetota bacterium]|nr:CIA30 family protein [Planctomycetota bacterium]
MKLVYLVGSLACWMVASLMADDTQRTLFDFSGADSAKEWQTVNDGVMGGVSDGRFKITDAKTMEFFGTL